MYVRGRPPWYRSVDHIHLLEGLRMAGCEDDCEPTSRRGSCRDVAGYSRLMGADEEGTLERLKTLRRDLLDPKISEHHRHIVKTTGDGMLVEFASVVDAERCAAAVQQAMSGRNTGVAAASAAKGEGSEREYARL
jgi:class 3 adenylate cyclase